MFGESAVSRMGLPVAYRGEERVGIGSAQHIFS